MRICLLALSLALLASACSHQLESQSPELRAQHTRASSASFKLKRAPKVQVVRVVDGDTVYALESGGLEKKLRLFGIDAPERGQPFGAKAKKALISLCQNQNLQLRVHGKDRYGRLLAELILPAGENINTKMLERGLAWWYERYAPTREDFKRAQQIAKSRGRGLWVDPRPTPPWTWRKNRRQFP